jgi:DNA-binding NtrC family response regulator
MTKTKTETELDADSQMTAPVEVSRLRFEVVEGPERGTRFSSDTERMSIGTHPSSDFVLSDRTISRFHCEVIATEGRARLRDLGSRNGSLVDGVPVIEAYLRDQSLIGMGKTVLRCSFDDVPSTVRLSRSHRFGSLVGRSVPARAAFALLEKAAASDVTVLLEGETGTGKEEAARSIHEASSRAEAPFVVVDCGALSPTLVESELFGHVRGAFTGADKDRPGAFVAGHGGTVFLDEIGELALLLQPKLLRVLEDRTVQPVGSSARRPVDVRIVAATRRELREEVNTGGFRSDLYFRLAVLRVVLPALRSRPDDIPILVRRLVEQLDVDDATVARLASPEALARMQQHVWPGNVRELRNYLELSAVLGGHGRPGAPALSGDPNGALDPRLSYAQARAIALVNFERQYLTVLLDHHRGNVTALARATGMNRSYVHELLRKHGVRGG